MNTEQNTKAKWRDRFKKMGWGAFFFFLIKGLVWLAVFYGLWDWLKELF